MAEGWGVRARRIAHWGCYCMGFGLAPSGVLPSIVSPWKRANPRLPLVACIESAPSIPEDTLARTEHSTVPSLHRALSKAARFGAGSGSHRFHRSWAENHCGGRGRPRDSVAESQGWASFTQISCAHLFLLLTASAALSGCVERRYTIRTDPPGATVVVNGEEIGPSPASKSFIYYGDRKITLILTAIRRKR